MSFDELYDPLYEAGDQVHYINDPTATVTFFCKNVHIKKEQREIPELIGLLKEFEKYFLKDYEDDLIKNDMSKHYYSFYIPKSNGKMRKIDAPTDELKTALRTLKDIFQNNCGVLYHTSAFAYIKKRQTLGAVKKHQRNKSKWFMKFDFSDFFGSTTFDFVWSQMSKIYPFSSIMKSVAGRDVLHKCIRLCFLNGVLPQGTPISPLITNIMMIPIDFKICNELTKERFIYTRYADDMIISHRYTFDSVFQHGHIDTHGRDGCEQVEKIITDILKEEDAPFALNKKKTRYGSSSGHNFLFGVIINKDDNITIGHKNKKLFKATLHNYIFSKQKGEPWELGAVQSLNGKISYYKSIEPKAIDEIIENYNTKFNINIRDMLKKDLST
ncbi:MAG: reverse transcriptase domain-containing protein [Rikenellaceae bacterium]